MNFVVNFAINLAANLAVNFAVNFAAKGMLPRLGIALARARSTASNSCVSWHVIACEPSRGEGCGHRVAWCCECRGKGNVLAARGAHGEGSVASNLPVTACDCM